MAGDDYDYESDGGNPSTPKKTPNRAKERKIVRWTDEKLAICFADFRVYCQKYRIDIKKPLEDAARSVADFVTADALIQQLSKRRTRFNAEKNAAKQAVQGKTEKKATGSARKELTVKTTNASPASAKRGTPASQKRRKTALQVEVDSLNRGGAPSPPETSSPAVAQTPKTSSKRKPRATGSRARKNSIQKIKEETDEVISPLTRPLRADNSDSESDYCESPTKAKKKRVRGKRSTAKKVQDYTDEVEVETPRDDRFNIDATRTHSFDTVYVDEAGGENALVKSGSSNDNSPDEAKYAGKHPPRTSSLNPYHGRRDSYQSHTISPQLGHAANPNMGQIEDVFVEQGGMQHVNTRPLNPTAQSFGGMAYMNGFGDNPFMVPMQQMQPNVPNMPHLLSQAYINNMVAAQAHQLPQMPSSDLDSDPSSQEQEVSRLQDSFNTMASADNSFMHNSFDGLPEMGHMTGFDTLDPLQLAHDDEYGHGHGFYLETTDKPTPSKALASGLDSFRI